MSEEAKPVCVACGMSILGTPYGGACELRHFNGVACATAMQREITALRAAHEALLRRTQSLETALDQERAWSAKAEAMLRGIRKDSGYMRISMMAPGIDALLSGRGDTGYAGSTQRSWEGGNDG